MEAVARSEMPTDTDLVSSDQTVQGFVTDWLSRVEFVFLATSDVATAPLCALLERTFGAALRQEINSRPVQHVFEEGEIRWQVDWISRIVPGSGRAFYVNFLMTHDDIGPTQRPVRFATLLCHPLVRIAQEFLSFQKEVAARGHADEETHRLCRDIVAFADAHWRNDYMVRFFSRRDLCDPINADAERAAKAALRDIDIVGLDQDLKSFASRLLASAPFSNVKRRNLVSALERTRDEAAATLVKRMDRGTREALVQRNLADLALHDWAVGGMR